MPNKNYYEYKDIMEATGKSYSAVKKWRISIERLSGYEFKKVKIKVTRKHVKTIINLLKKNLKSLSNFLSELMKQKHD